ncbi:MAG: SPOR domain-containing protein [Caulobacteraceae bacterium]|nr:SPOR domain-containing protein [Caulobacteraceae bacterium]
MSDYDRGAYTPPTDDHLAFDARMPRQRRPMPMTLIASAVVLLVMVGAVFAFYTSGVRGANEPPRVVGQSAPPIKGPPVQEARPLDVDDNLEVYVDDGADGQGAPTFAPAPEQPQARPAPTVVAAGSSGEARSGVTVLRPAPSPVTEAALPPAAPTAVPAKAAPVPPPAKAAPAPTRVAEAPRSSAGGAASVQIGAFSSAEIANSEYAKVRAAFARYTAGRGKHVEPVQRDGQTLYRTAFTGFAREDAQAFCAALKAAGRACIVK